ncbi:PREDICTED: ankyrin repeat-containing protein NPR4-like isoform X2 [Ipomoea nil]|uniref:ankyrin repeat-containing protein NPR4-like isoform X2 n=1 Tax=Ipomoea nil TaxID=35883 RepID=UPI000901A0AC|nr:PREDICTED: ankyrin repeat-containing protein NPR4-like isoform X2 [Ipomoea nil]
MDGLQRTLKLERTLSIQSCFPRRTSNPTSNESSEVYNSISTAEHVISLQQTTHHDHTQSKAAAAAAPPSSNPLRDETARPAAASFPARPRTQSANLAMYIPLYQAALKGDWEKANEFISLHPDAITARISKGWETALHIAAGANHIHFVEELVELMDPMDLALRNKHDNTALCFAAASGITRIAETMVIKNTDLPVVRGSKGVTPLHMAALLGHREMVWYLYSVTDSQCLNKEDYVGLLIATINSDLLDVTLHILMQKPGLAIERDPNGETVLHILARKPSAFSGKHGLGLWQKWMYTSISVHPQSKFSHSSHDNKYIEAHPFHTRLLGYLQELFGVADMKKRKLMCMEALELFHCSWEQAVLLSRSQLGDLLKTPFNPLFVAAELGNIQFVVQLIRSYPDLIWKVNEQSQSVFHIAVVHRQENIFRLIYNIGAHKDIIASYLSTDNENMLHLAAKIAPSNRLNIVSGAALQMQRELLWFKEVEKIVQPSYKEMKDSGGQTPRMLFTEQHKSLVKQGEKWMKDTASSCMLVATLITTIMFAAILTVPGGNNNETGNPIFLQDKLFVAFAVSDAIALFSSVTSILMFLSILTSRYAEEDFVSTLPKRLVFGLATLFLSITAMLVAFGSSFSIVLRRQLAWVVLPVELVACLPVTLFAFLQFPLLADTIRSTYGSGMFTLTQKDMLY